MKIGPLLAQLDELEASYAAALRRCAEQFPEDYDVFHQCLTFADATERGTEGLVLLRQRFDGKPEWETVSVRHGRALLEELRALYLLAHQVAVTWAMALQAAKAVRDAELEELAAELHTEAETQAKWFLTRIKVAAPQALVVG